MADILSLEAEDGWRCLDIVSGPDGAFGFKDFPRDPEEGGGWTLVADYTAMRYATREDAPRAAARSLAWFDFRTAAAGIGTSRRGDDVTENAG